MKHRMISLALAAALGLGLAVPALAASPFTDVPETYWAYEAILEAYDGGVLQGVGDGRFAPEDTLTLAQWSVMLARGYYGEEIETVPEENWYNREMAVLEGRGLYENVDGEVPVDAEICRSDMAAMIWNLLADQGVELPGPDVLRAVKAEISDLEETPEAQRDAVAACFHLGILNGTEPGVFSGGQPVRRDAAAAVYARVCRQLEEAPKEEDAPQSSGVLDAPEAPDAVGLTEARVLETILALRETYPEGMYWTNGSGYTSAAKRTTGYGCYGFALLCTDAAFGDLPAAETHSDFDRVRVGDMLRVNYDSHSVVVLEKRADSVVVTEGNYDSIIHWGRELTRAELERGNFYVTTRYPK